VNPSDTIFSAAGQVATFTLNRPETGHAMTWAMYDALLAACDRVDTDSGVRVFVIRATGGVFCTGTDIGQFADFTSAGDGLEYERRLDTCVTRLEHVRVPTIAQVEGIAAGAGCVIALACDLRVCTPAARFGVPIARTLGNALSLANCARLVEHLGLSRTKDLLLTGRLLDVTEASSVGLVTRMAEPADVDRVVGDLAATIGRHAPLTLRAMKQALLRQSTLPARDIDDAVAACYGSHDFREGVAAFLEKRPPKFTGR
jgi:enoyl-CoA hydratase/carnithine racemase